MYSKLIFLFIPFKILFVKSYYSKENVGSISIKNILNASEKLQLVHPNVLEDEQNILSKKQKHNLVKSLSNNNQLCRFVTDVENLSNSPILIFQNKPRSKFSFRFQNKALVISTIKNETDLTNVNLRIDEEVYFLDWYSKHIYEVYSINSMQVIQKLSMKELNTQFERRRGNFHGTELIGLTEQFSTFVTLPYQFEEFVKYHEENDTFEITDIVQGSYIEILKYAENHLNFSSKLFKRRDGLYGFPKQFPNGTIVFSGMLKSLVEGSVDFSWAAFAMTTERSSFIDYLSSTLSLSAAIYIPRNKVGEDVDWYVYLGPFSSYLWITILILVIVMTLVTILIEKSHGKRFVSSET